MGKRCYTENNEIIRKAEDSFYEQRKPGKSQRRWTEVQLITFLLHDIRYGVPVRDVVSIENAMDVICVPNTLPQVHGIMKLHGEVIAAYSLAELFHYPKEKIGNLIVVNIQEMKLALEVEQVLGIIEVPEEEMTPMPQIADSEDGCFGEIASYQKDLIVLLDVARIVPESEQEGIKELVEQHSA